MTFDYAAIADLLEELPARFAARRKALGVTLGEVWADDRSVSQSSWTRFERGDSASLKTYQAVLRFLARTEESPGPTPDRSTPDTSDGSR